MFVLAWSVMRFHRCHDETITRPALWLSSLVFKSSGLRAGPDNWNCSCLGRSAPSAVRWDR